MKQRQQLVGQEVRGGSVPEIYLQELHRVERTSPLALLEVFVPTSTRLNSDLASPCNGLGICPM